MELPITIHYVLTESHSLVGRHSCRMIILACTKLSLWLLGQDLSVYPFFSWMWTKTQHPMLFCVMSREHLHFSCPGKEVRLSWEGLGLDTCHFHYVFRICFDWLVDVLISLTSITWGICFQVYFSSLTFFSAVISICSSEVWFLDVVLFTVNLYQK